MLGLELKGTLIHCSDSLILVWVGKVEKCQVTERIYEGFKNRMVHCQKLRTGEEIGAFVSIMKKIYLVPVWHYSKMMQICHAEFNYT